MRPSSRVGMEQHGVPVVHTCLFFACHDYFCRYRSELALVRVGRRWYSLLSFGLDLILNVGLPVPAATEFRR